jgi:hypothetical protein
VEWQLRGLLQVLQQRLSLPRPRGTIAQVTAPFRREEGAMPRAVGQRRAPDRDKPSAFTAAQERVLIEALRSHPQPIQQPNARVAAVLVSAGAFRQAGTEGDSSFALTPQGLDFAARLTAQTVIDEVNARRAGGALQGAKSGASASSSNSRPGGKPSDWPFPVSAHAW